MQRERGGDCLGELAIGRGTPLTANRRNLDGRGKGVGQVKGIPFIVFDVGGVMEMLDPVLDASLIIGRPDLDVLSQKLEGVAPLLQIYRAQAYRV